MESKKRPHDEDAADTIVKRRIVSSDDGTPHINGGIVSDSAEPTEGDNLELFRKEAIFRRMRHYAREHERSQARVAELERRKQSCEAGLAIMSACWSQLVETIRSLVTPDEVPNINVDAKRLFELTAKSPSERQEEIASELKNNLTATKALVTKLAQLSGNNVQLDDATVYKYQDECKLLQAEVILCRSQVEDLHSRNDQLQDALHMAESRFDRSRIASVTAMQKRPVTKEDEAKRSQDTQSPEPKVEPSSHSPSSSYPTSNGKPPEETFQALDNFRDRKLREYEEENERLKYEVVQLQAQLKSATENAPPSVFQKLDEFVKKVEYFTSPHQYQSATEARLEQALKDIVNATNDMAASLTIKPDDKALLIKRDTDIARLREQRDQLSAELIDRKHKDSQKMNSAQAYKAGYESRGARLSSLEAELKRYKARLLNIAGHDDLLEFLVGGDADIVSELKKRLKSAESRVKSLEEIPANLEATHSDVAQYMKSEAALRQELQDVSSRLEKYQAIYGNLSSLPPDVKQLAEELERKENELKELHEKASTHEQVEVQLSSEVDRLSAAWEDLDKKMSDKIFDLTSMEERLSKLAAERSKTENKYFAAMREKDALEVERKTIQKEREKVSHALEKSKEMNQQLESQITVLKDQAAMLIKAIQGSDAAMHDLDAQILGFQKDLEHQRRQFMEANTKLQYLESSASKRLHDLRKQEEAMIRMKKDFDKQLAKVKDVSTSHATQNSDPHYARMQEILQCRICKVNIRDSVITKCMHTFCRACLDARIATRQRKCPSCQLAFGQGDVQPVYFQG